MKSRLLLWSITASLAGFLFGFDTIVISGAEYFGIPYSNDMWPGNNHGNPVTNREPYEPLPVMRGNEAVAYVSDGADQSLLCEAVTDAAIKFIEDHRDESFFCYVPRCAGLQQQRKSPPRGRLAVYEKQGEADMNVFFFSVHNRETSNEFFNLETYV